METNTNPEQQDLNLPAVAKDSSNGSNSIESQDAEFCKKKYSREKDQASPSSKEFFLSECEEVPRRTLDLDLEKLPEDDADESSDLEGTTEEWKGSNLPDSTESFQDLGSSDKIASTSPKSKPYNSQVGMDSFPKDPITYSQDSSIQKS